MSIRASNVLRRSLHQARQGKFWLQWSLGGFGPNLPAKAKLAVLNRYSIPDAVWIESGTYFGDTTFALARKGKTVHTIEASPSLVEQAKTRFRRMPQITVHAGDSGEIMETLLGALDGNSLNFWLDGHFSGGMTFKGVEETPIRRELEIISERLATLDQVAVFVDDFRCFPTQEQEQSDYPSREFLIDWASSLRLDWTVEHDIFVATQRDVFRT